MAWSLVVYACATMHCDWEQRRCRRRPVNMIFQAFAGQVQTLQHHPETQSRSYWHCYIQLQHIRSRSTVVANLCGVSFARSGFNG